MLQADLIVTATDTFRDISGHALRYAILQTPGRWLRVALEQIPHTPGFPGGGTRVEVCNRNTGAKTHLAVGSDLTHGLVEGYTVAGYTRQLVEKLLAEIA